MATPIIKISQPGGVGDGDPGICLTVVAGFGLAFEDTESANSSASYLWSVLSKPVSSTFDIVSPATATPTGPDPEVPGTVWISCTATIGDSSWESVIGFAVNLPNSDQRIPGFGEGTEWNEAGNEQGHAAAIASFMEWADGNSGVRVSDNDTTVGNLEEKIVGLGDVAVSTINEGGNEQLQISVDLSGAEADIAALDGRLDTAESDIDALQAADTSLDSRLDTAESDIDGLEADFTTIETRFDRAIYGWMERPSYLGAPSVYDDHFTGASLDAKWTPRTSFSASAIDPYALIATNPRVDYAGIHPSCLTVQVHDASTMSISQTIALATDCWVWARAIAANRRVMTPGSIDYSFWGVGLHADANDFSADYLDLTLGPQDNGGGDFLLNLIKRQSGSTTFPVTAQTYTEAVEQFTQAFLQKISNTYHVYARQDGGVWRYFGSTTHTGSTLDNLVIRWSCDGATYSSIFHQDFVLYGTGKPVLPP